MFCGYCGYQNIDEANFCISCGKPTGNRRCQNQSTAANQSNFNQQSYTQQQSYQPNFQQNYSQPFTPTSKNVLQSLSEKEKLAGIVWIVVASIQVLLGIGIVSFWNYTYFYLILIGGWNYYAASTRFKYSKQLLVNPIGVYQHYEKSLASVIVFIVLNAVLGGIVGVAGAIYDLVVRNYAMTNKEALMSFEEQARAQSTYI